MRPPLLSDQLPYEFIPPRFSRSWFWLGGFYNRSRMRKEHRVEEIDVSGLDRLTPLLDRGDSVLITPNHPDHADCYVLYELSRRLNRPFSYLAAYQIFVGLARRVLPRVGVFSIDREGADLSAFRTAVGILSEGRQPLVIFPEGEIYRVAERVTPLREGAFSIAVAAARKLEGAGRRLWILPVGLSYRFLEGQDPLPSLESLMARLEARFTWRVQSGRPLPERILRYADGILGLKEVEYLGNPQYGSFKERSCNLMERILGRIEGRRLKGKTSGTIPQRVKEMRRVCLDVLQDSEIPSHSPEAVQARADLDDLFLVIQIFSYPADYVRRNPTVERIAETLLKCEEDFLDVSFAAPRAARRAVVRFGQPIDLCARLAAEQARPRQQAGLLAAEVEASLQELLDGMPPGRPLLPSGHSPTGQEISADPPVMSA
ncbi:MAG: lysophospholipid acyltransferase family protein [Isosphaeraceae bacterium]